jgi:hypothetical protein
MRRMEPPNREATMDFHSLVATHVSARRHRARMDARAEDRYYRDQAGLPRPRLRPLAPIATAAGLILLLIGVAQA